MRKSCTDEKSGNEAAFEGVCGIRPAYYYNKKCILIIVTNIDSYLAYWYRVESCSKNKVRIYCSYAH